MPIVIDSIGVTETGSFPVLRIRLNPEVDEYDTGSVASALIDAPECRRFMRLFLTEACRGVALDRFEQVIATGIDVEPSDAPIWVSSLDKAMEYGGWPKLILLLDPHCLDRTFREVGGDCSEATRADIIRQFPTELPSVDGTSRWFSRLPATDRRITSGYEIAYARWIPGDARAALRAVLLVEHPKFDVAGLANA